MTMADAGDVIARTETIPAGEMFTPAQLQEATGASMHSVWYALGQLEERGWAGPVSETDRTGPWRK